MAQSAVHCIRVDILREEALDLSLDAVYDKNPPLGFLRLCAVCARFPSLQGLLEA